MGRTRMFHVKRPGRPAGLAPGAPVRSPGQGPEPGFGLQLGASFRWRPGRVAPRLGVVSGILGGSKRPQDATAAMASGPGSSKRPRWRPYDDFANQRPCYVFRSRVWAWLSP